jgi:hypothetical protein
MRVNAALVVTSLQLMNMRDSVEDPAAIIQGKASLLDTVSSHHVHRSMMTVKYGARDGERAYFMIGLWAVD